MKISPISHFKVYGKSMLPTLKPGQDVLVFNWAYIFSKPKNGDIVVIRVNSRDMVKRIQRVQGYECFVEGDNKETSTDSRDFGVIDRSRIVGKVIFINK